MFLRTVLQTYGDQETEASVNTSLRGFENDEELEMVTNGSVNGILDPAALLSRV